VSRLLLEVRPDAVALVDAFGFEDYLLNSALGRKDGDVYRCEAAPGEANFLGSVQEMRSRLGRRGAHSPTSRKVVCLSICPSVHLSVTQINQKVAQVAATRSRSSSSDLRQQMRFPFVLAPFRALLEMAQSSPLNATEEGPAWKEVLEPRLNPQLRAATRSRM
jgi:Acyl-CoA oxidase